MKGFRLPLLCAFAAYGFSAGATDNSAPKNVIDGYPIANFALAINASANGDMYGRIWQNTGVLGEWLADKGAVRIAIAKDGKRHTLSGFAKKDVVRSFPFVRSKYSASALTPVSIEAETFCPLAVNDARTSALPVVMLEFVCKNSTSKEESFSIVLEPDDRAAQTTEGMQPAEAANLYGAANAKCAIVCNMPLNYAQSAIPIRIAPRSEQTLRIAIALYDKEWIAAAQFARPLDIAAYAMEQWHTLRSKTVNFAAAIPTTGDTQLDNYIRWYTVPAIALTRCTAKGDVLTMGYREFNQRDSYWTTWLHLLLYRDLEWQMLLESVKYQQPSGKIPTTILPLIERHDDLDINAFFILRMARYYRQYHNHQQLREVWSSVKNAAQWLIERDCSGEGLPCQASFWGDWKDVLGVQGRRYSPFTAFTYLAAMKETAAMAQELGDRPAQKRYSEAYDRGFAFVNKNVEDGGLWNGSYYCQRWQDGSVNTHLLQDQTIGILYSVVPHERCASIFDALNRQSATPYGIAETTPYYPKEWGYAPATYHNGAVWPWLSFVDCWARVKAGRRAEAIDLIKRVGNADLEASGDYSPNEHINSTTGENLGFILQGWNAGLFGLAAFELAK